MSNTVTPEGGDGSQVTRQSPLNCEYCGGFTSYGTGHVAYIPGGELCKVACQRCAKKRDLAVGAFQVAD